MWWLHLRNMPGHGDGGGGAGGLGGGDLKCTGASGFGGGGGDLLLTLYDTTFSLFTELPEKPSDAWTMKQE